jgi:GT2 family glycosyltransferase
MLSAEMSAEPLFSVVIPTCARPELLARCLDSLALALQRIREPHEVIVSDASRDSVTAELLAARYPWVSHTARPQAGPARNRNHGASLARGSWLLFTDDDCIPSPEWAAAYLRAAGEFPHASVLEGRTTSDREPRRFDEEAPINPSGGYLWACNMAIRRDVLVERLGGFCEQFPVPGSEDSDLRLRLAKAGATTRFVPDAVVCHPIRPSKGLRFQVDVARAHVQLLDRHPELLGTRPLRGAALGFAYRLAFLARDGLHYRFRGFGYALGRLAIHTVFEMRAAFRLALRSHAR